MRERRPSLVPDLHHILLTHTTPNPQQTTLSIVGTYTSPALATAAAKRRLFDEGFSRKHFQDLSYNAGQANWPHDPDVVVHAEGVDGEVVEVRVDITPNTLGVRARVKEGDGEGEGDVREGRVEEELWYVVVKKTKGKEVDAEVRGIYLSQVAAVQGGRHELLGKEGGKGEFAEYEEIRGEDEEAIVKARGKDGWLYEVCVVGES
jgi:hypothetical protein